MAAGSFPQVLIAPDQTTAADSSGGGSVLSGIADIFGSISTGITNVYRTVNPPTPVNIPGQLGGYIYNPTTGQYQSAVQGVQPINSQMLLLFLGIGVVLLIVLRKKPA